MTTLSVTVDANGISRPDFATVYSGVQSIFQNIYGSDIQIGPDSMDGQLVMALATMIDDNNQACVAAWNNQSPQTAVGAGLSSVVKINNIQREVATSSTAVVVVGGVAGTVITGGIVTDSAGTYQWALPDPTTIGIGGSTTVTATCTTPGAIAAAPGSLTVKVTSVSGWNTVSNASAATPGAPVEQDGALRTRQSQSTQLPARTLLGSMLGNVKNVPGVVSASIYENDTASTNSLGIPAKSIAVVVSGGSATAVAQAIMNSKGPGPDLYGSTTVSLVDDVGQTQSIKFTVPTVVNLDLAITIKALTGYTTTVGAKVDAALVAWFNAFVAGQPVVWSDLFTPAKLMSVAPTTGLITQDPDAVTFRVEAITVAKHTLTLAQADITLAYNELAVLPIGNITRTVV